MKNTSRILYLPLEVNREITFMLYNYKNIDKLIDERKDELIDKMKISKDAYLKSIKNSNNILEDIIIKFEDDIKIKRFKTWRQLINKFMSYLYDEEDNLYYSLMKYKYQDKLTEEFIRDKANLEEHELKEIANRTYAELGIIQENDSNYQIVEVQRQLESINGVMNDMWQVSYGKIYDGLIDRNSMFSTCFSVIDGKKIFYMIKGKTDSTFNSNEIILSQEDAIEIAINKEKDFSKLDISEVSAVLSIEKMNLFIYYLENNIENDDVYKIDDVARIVWVVEVKHKKEERITRTDLKTVKEFYNKKYYIDASTGEIIGGKQSEIFE